MNATQIEEHAVALAENAAMLLIAAEHLGIKYEAVEGFPLQESERAIVSNLPALPGKLKKKLAIDKAMFTVAETGSMVMAVAEYLLDAKPTKQATLLFIAKELMDCLQQKVAMSELPTKTSLHFMDNEPNDKLKLGKGRSFFVKSQLKRLRQEDDIWEADFFPMPQQSLWYGMVISHSDDFVLALNSIDEPPTVNNLANLLAEAMRRPLIELSHRPRTLYIRERPEWAELLPHLKQIGIRVECQDKLPKWDDAFGDLHAQVEKIESSTVIMEENMAERESLALKLSPGQRTTVLQYTTLPDHLTAKVANIAANQFTPDELDDLLDHIERIGHRAKGNDKQKIQRIVAKISNVLGSDIDAAEFSKHRSSEKTDCVFQIKITLRETDPPIWRRIQVKDCTLETLHALIQVTMGWEFAHPYCFQIGGVEFGDVEWDMNGEVRDVCDTKLSDVIPASHRRPRFYYEYDFGDEWRHQLIVEERLSPAAGVAYPVCIAGARACPPEDCGGAWRYGDFLEAIHNPKHEQHEEMLEWIGGEFDPAAFDLEAVNRELARIG